MIKFRVMMTVLCIGAFAFMIAGCEKSGNGSSASAVESDNSSSDSKIDGRWGGNAGSGGASASMVLSSQGNSISGTMTWPGNDVRSVNGHYTGGNTASLNIGGGDVWNVYWHKNSMSGTGNKKGGGTYSVSFNR